MTRLKERYVKDVVPALAKEFGYKNVMAIPKLEKIVVNMGLGEATQNVKLIDAGADEVGRITGQRSVTTRAKKSIAAFKVRKGMPVGTMVTLRGDRMYEFLDRLISITLPRVKDFRGISSRSFDGRGNYTLGLRDQLIFQEIVYEKVEKVKGMNICITTTAKTDAEALAQPLALVLEPALLRFRGAAGLGRVSPNRVTVPRSRTSTRTPAGASSR